MTPTPCRRSSASWATGPTADLAVAMLARFDTPESTLKLAEMAVANPSPWVRGAAIKALRGRDTRDYVGTLVDLIRSAIKLHVQPVGRPGSAGGDDRRDAAGEDDPDLRRPDRLPARAARRGLLRLRRRRPAGRRHGRPGARVAVVNPTLQRHVVDRMKVRAASNIAEANLKCRPPPRPDGRRHRRRRRRRTRRLVPRNVRVAAVLRETINAPDLGNDEDAWKTWHYDRLGYRYEPPTQVTVTVDASPQPPPPTHQRLLRRRHARPDARRPQADRGRSASATSCSPRT